jgi:hypothetical protein
MISEKMTPTVQPENEGDTHIHSVEDLRNPSAYLGRKADMIVEGLLRGGTITLLTGESGSGKSTFLDSLAYSISTGSPFAGRQVSKRKVMSLDRENPLETVVDRRDLLGIPQDTLPGFRVWGQWCDEDEPPQPDSDVVIRWIAACDPKPVLIVDSLIAFMGCDENNATEVRRYMQRLRNVAGTGAAVIAIHHTGKGDNSKEYRGSSDLKASVDVGYKVTNGGGSTRITTLELTCFKLRNKVELSLTLDFIPEVGFVKSGATVAAKLQSIMDQYLAKHPEGINGSEFEKLALAADVPRGTIRVFLNKKESTRGAKNARIFRGAGKRRGTRKK